MNKEFKDTLKGTASVPVGLALLLVPFSFLIGWNLMTLIGFWLVVTPAIAIYLPTLVSWNRNHLIKSLAGLVIFYGIMVFMIYDHYKSDYFQLMIFSLLINLVFIPVIIWATKSEAQA